MVATVDQNHAAVSWICRCFSRMEDYNARRQSRPSCDGYSTHRLSITRSFLQQTVSHLYNGRIGAYGVSAKVSLDRDLECPMQQADDIVSLNKTCPLGHLFSGAEQSLRHVNRPE